jgi:hypothetical protein
MQLSHLPTAQDFLDRAGAFLLTNEAVNNLPLGVAGNIRAHPERFMDATPYLAIVEDGGVVLAAAVRTPPYNLALALIHSREALELIARDAHALYPDLDRAMGPHPSIQQFVEIWCALTGQSSNVKLAMGVYQLTQVKPPTGVPGRFRRATAQDKDLLVRWRIDFSKEALGEDPDPAEVAKAIDSMLTSPVRGIGVWEDRRVVSIAAYSGPTPHGIRIGSVYTPPELRGRGYASACVAALSQMLLDGGYSFCFLFTDLANPTSNKIYQQIGYEQVGEAAEYEFIG